MASIEAVWPELNIHAIANNVVSSFSSGAA